MATDSLRRYTDWATLVAGGLESLGLIFLILFFALALPQGSTSPLRFRYLSDITPIIVASGLCGWGELFFITLPEHSPLAIWTQRANSLRAEWIYALY